MPLSLLQRSIKKILSRLYKKQSGEHFIEQLFSEFNLTPNNIKYYQEAFTHRSFNETYNNERLEFLGDAVLSKVIAEFLYNHFPELNEGELSKMRSLLTSRKYLNKRAKELRIFSYLNAHLQEKEAQKNVLGNTLEALIGAIYLDLGENTVKKFILSYIIQNHDKESILSLDDDYKSKIYHWTQAQNAKVKYHCKQLPGGIFEVEMYINNQLIAKGQGKNKKAAEQTASRKAWEKLQNNTMQS